MFSGFLLKLHQLLSRFWDLEEQCPAELAVLSYPGLYRSLNGRRVARARRSKQMEEMLDECPKEPSCPGWEASFCSRAKKAGGEEVTTKDDNAVANTSWFWLDSRGDVLASSFLRLFTAIQTPWSGFSCELNKGILA